MSGSPPEGGPRGLPAGARHLIVWLLIGTALFVAVQAWQEQRSRPRVEQVGGRVVLQRGLDGHYHWPGRVNGVAVDFLIDTGATRTALPAALAREAGVTDDGERVRSQTAGGLVEGHTGRARIALDGGPVLERWRVTVLPQLDSPLLGMDVLQRMGLQVAPGGNTLTLEPMASTAP